MGVKALMSDILSDKEGLSEIWNFRILAGFINWV